MHKMGRKMMFLRMSGMICQNFCLNLHRFIRACKSCPYADACHCQKQWVEGVRGMAHVSKKGGAWPPVGGRPSGDSHPVHNKKRPDYV